MDLHAIGIVHFTALRGMQTRSYDENSVRPSVRPSVKRVANLNIEIRQNRYVSIHLLHLGKYNLYDLGSAYMLFYSCCLLEFWVKVYCKYHKSCYHCSSV